MIFIHMIVAYIESLTPREKYKMTKTFYDFNILVSDSNFGVP